VLNISLETFGVQTKLKRAGNEKVKNNSARRRWITFKPEADTWIALITIPAMTLLYYLNTHYGFEHPAVFFIGFVFLGHLILTQNKVVTSFAISFLLAASMYPSLVGVLKSFDGSPAPNITYNAIAFWEPLFVFGWLQLRFERAYGVIPGVFMAGLGFMAYHIGSFPPDALAMLCLTGIFYGAIFAYVKNLLVLIPMTWAVASTMGTLQGGYSFDWFTVAIYAAILMIQCVILWYFSRSKSFNGSH